MGQELAGLQGSREGVYSLPGSMGVGGGYFQGLVGVGKQPGWWGGIPGGHCQGGLVWVTSVPSCSGRYWGVGAHTVSFTPGHLGGEVEGQTSGSGQIPCRAAVYGSVGRGKQRALVCVCVCMRAHGCVVG